MTSAPVPDKPGRADGAVRAILRHDDGRLEEVLASYLLVCDREARGAVRNLAGSADRTSPFAPACLVAELRADGGLPEDQLGVYLGRGYLAVFPLGGGRYRCVASSPRRAAHDDAAEALRQVLDAIAPAPRHPVQLFWHRRIPACRSSAPVLRRGPTFFAGDAAHASYPASTHVVNAGVQDVINLSWKLAVVLRGQADPALLDTYGAERLGVIRETARRADLAVSMFGAPSRIARQLVTRVAAAFLDARFVLRLGADLVGEIATDYRGSPLSASGGGPGDLHPGDSMPAVRVLACDADAPADARPRDVGLYELVERDRLTLLFTAGATTAPSAWQVLEPWRSTIRAHRIAPINNRPDERSRFMDPFGGSGVLVVRQDLYVAFTGRRRAAGRLASWLATWFPAPAGVSAAGRRAA